MLTPRGLTWMTESRKRVCSEITLSQMVVRKYHELNAPPARLPARGHGASPAATSGLIPCFRGVAGTPSPGPRWIYFLWVCFSVDAIRSQHISGNAVGFCSGSKWSHQLRFCSQAEGGMDDRATKEHEAH